MLIVSGDEKARSDKDNADATSATSEVQVALASNSRSIDVPAECRPFRIHWRYAIALAAVHLLGFLVFVPAYFSYSGLAVAIFAHILFDGFGVSIGYHRLLTHRGFVCPRWLEYSMAICGICTLQDSPARWVAIHRMHHQHSDEQPDPHSPLVAFLWSHVGWLLYVDQRHDHLFHYERYVRDMLRQPFYLWLERKFIWFWIYVAHAVLITAAGFGVGMLMGKTVAAGLALAWSWFIWGVIARTIFTLHVTWAVNSVCHLWGYRNFETSDESRNNAWIAAVTFGEGWHNNHHADQRSARHGLRWFEPDPSWWAICFMERIGLVSRVIGPREETKAQ